MASLLFLLLVLGEPRQPAVGAAVPGWSSLRIPGVAGGVLQPATLPAKAVVLVFLGLECPVSNFYTSHLDALARKYLQDGVIFVGVYSEMDVTLEQAAEHGKEYKIGFRCGLDKDQTVAKACDIRFVPEVAVISPQGKLLYRGRIDDRFAKEKGKRREEPRHRELIDAVEAVLAGRPVAVSEAEGYGCPLPRRKN